MSFLADIKEGGLLWDKDDGQDDMESSSDSSIDDDDVSDEEPEEEVQPAPPLEAALNELANAGIVLADNVNQNVDDEPVENDNAQEVGPPITSRPLFSTVMEKVRHHSRNKELIFRVVRCEEEPVIRGEINWDLLTSQIKNYPAEEVGDDRGTILLQGILHMDPPVSIMREALAVYPKACVSMDLFYFACQHVTRDIDEVIELVIRQTTNARNSEGIQWGMLAFLGDPRIQTRHAMILLQSMPEAVTDAEHGTFGVSPLDRMLSGAFIHGNDADWMEKLKLALLTARFGSVDYAVERDTAGGRDWFPFHSLIRRLISKDFMGVNFGPFSFIKTLTACVRSGFSCQNNDSSGYLPIHIALRKECNTNLSILGERKLIRFLLQEHPQAAETPDCDGVLPLRMAIMNGWPCYDIIVDASTDTNGCHFLHIALSGKYHSWFGVSGAREIVKDLIQRFPKSVVTPNKEGRLPLHLAVENGWPCHDIIMAAAPLALQTRDVTNGFYPFQILAGTPETTIEEGNVEIALRKLSVLYEMIRDGPLLTHGLAGGVDHESKDTSTIAVDTEEHDDRDVQIEAVEDKIDSFCRKRKLPHSLSAINKSMISSGKSVIH